MSSIAKNRFIALSMILAAGLALGAVLPAINSAYASDNENNSNSTSSAGPANQGHNWDNKGGNSTDTGRNDHKSDSSYSHYKSRVEQMRDEFASMNAAKRHHEHMMGHPTITPPYLANLSYTLDANGNATGPDMKKHESAQLLLDMSIWKSSDSLVAMDINGGNITIGGNVTTISGGHAYYLAHHPRLIVYAYTLKNASSSQASAPVHDVKVLRAFAFGVGPDNKLPTNSSGSSFAVRVMGFESGPSSHLFKLAGQVSLNPNAGSGGSAEHTVMLTIPSGASVSGHQSYSPDNATAETGDTIQVTNNDTAIHTLTSGSGPSDPHSGKMFDTGFINPGKTATFSLAKVSVGTYGFYCQVHPFMKGSLRVTS